MKRFPLIASVLVFVAIGVIYLLQFEGVANMLHLPISEPELTNIVYLVPPLIAVISGIIALRTFHISSAQGKVFAWLAAGLASWLIAESVYCYRLLNGLDPSPSVADWFFVLGYPLLFIGLIQEIRDRRASWKDTNKFMIASSVLLGLALAFIVSYFGIYRGWDPEISTATNLLYVGYAVGDLFLIAPAFLVLKMASDFRGGKLFYSWMMVFVALLLLMTGDILYAIHNESYESSVPAATLIDFTWITMYLLFAFSFFYTSSSIKNLKSRLKKPDQPVQGVTNVS